MPRPDAPDTAEEEPNDALEEPEEREEEQESEIVDLSEDTDAQPPVAVEETDTADIIPAAETGNDDDDDEEPERKAMVGWLVLFVMLAIPIGLAAAVILIVAAVAFLAVAAATVVTGIYAVKAAFSGFAIFADMLLSLSVAVAILALGLLFIWTAIWLLSGAVPDVIKGIIKLGRKWCYKEVEE